MKVNDLMWLGLIASSLGLGVVGGSYLKKDELLPICHSIAPGLFPPISVALPTQTGLFDSTLQHADQPWQVSFVGPACADACQSHLNHADFLGLPHLIVQWPSSEPVKTGDSIAVGNDVQFIQAAESVGLDAAEWSRPGYVATWRLNGEHHIERRWVNQPDALAWAD